MEWKEVYSGPPAAIAIPEGGYLCPSCGRHIPARKMPMAANITKLECFGGVAHRFIPGNEPFYMRVAEALERPGDPSMLQDKELLDAIELRNGITTRWVGPDAWETRSRLDLAGEATGFGRTPAAAVWDIVLKLKDAGLLVRP